MSTCPRLDNCVVPPLYNSSILRTPPPPFTVYNPSKVGRYAEASEPVYSLRKWKDESGKRDKILENMKSRDVAGLSNSLRESIVAASPRGGSGGGKVHAGVYISCEQPVSGISGGGGGRARPVSARTVRSAEDAVWGAKDYGAWDPPPRGGREDNLYGNGFADGHGSGVSSVQPDRGFPAALTYARPSSARRVSSKQPRDPRGGGVGVVHSFSQARGGARKPAVVAWGAASPELSNPETDDTQRRGLVVRIARIAAREVVSAAGRAS